MKKQNEKKFENKKDVKIYRRPKKIHTSSFPSWLYT